MTDEGFSSTGRLGVILSKAKNLFFFTFRQGSIRISGDVSQGLPESWD
jgi:hypothetical protein